MKRRGSLTIWISEDAIKSWNSKKSGKPGWQKKYSDLSIETALVVRLVYNLKWRQTVGFIESLFELMSIDLEVPHHTTLCRRSKNLGNIEIIKQDSLDTSLDIFIDSTGVGIHNGNKKKPTKNKSWRKFHAAVDGKGNIVASEITSNRAFVSLKIISMLHQSPLVPAVSRDSITTLFN